MFTPISKKASIIICAIIALCSFTVISSESAYAQQVVRCPSCGGTGTVFIGYNYYGQPMFNYCVTCGGRGQVISQGYNPSFKADDDKLLGTIYPYFYNWEWNQSNIPYLLYERPNGSLYVMMRGNSIKMNVLRSNKKDWEYAFYSSGWYYFNL